MSTYIIVAPCAYPVNGRLVRQRRPGAEVELDDATAKRLGKAVKPKPAPKPAEPQPQPSTPEPTGQEAAPDGG